MKEIYGMKAISRDRNKTAGTRAPPWYLCVLWWDIVDGVSLYTNSHNP
jgi:hypothetical protein